MSKERLTRQEISWLLAQEARGAARALRDGVVQLRMPSSPDLDVKVVETNLDALDEAIAQLGELQAGGATRARRGRIDLAALLCDLAPRARIALEPGAGTEVFGEESELRRMLHVLVSHASPTVPVEESTAEIAVRRESEWVRIRVGLGPDSSTTSEVERRWLNRMAVRHGGRLEMESDAESLLLPADGATDQREVVELRRELRQAQELGEAYARELAQVFAGGEVQDATPTTSAHRGRRLDLLIGSARSLARTLRPLAQAAVADAQLASAQGLAEPLSGTLARRASTLVELCGSLERAARLDALEGAVELDLGGVVRAAVAEVDARAARHGVSVSLRELGAARVRAPRVLTDFLLRAVLEHAIASTPRGGSVEVESGSGSGAEVVVRDGGPVVPEAQRDDVLQGRIDGGSLGRPEALSLLAGGVVAEHLGGALLLDETDGRAVLRLRFP